MVVDIYIEMPRYIRSDGGLSSGMPILPKRILANWISSTTPGTAVLQMSTVDVVPVEYIIALSKKYPDVWFDVIYMDANRRPGENYHQVLLDGEDHDPTYEEAYATLPQFAISKSLGLLRFLLPDSYMITRVADTDEPV